jgi:murein DD-endopeptidase MepM/ murein hydrolase activator NlpD
MPVRTPAPTPTPSRHPGAAPANAAEFELDSQVIPIEFPLKEGARYQYRDNFLDRREGEAYGYNHARIRRGDRLLRAHDGTDIYAAEGTPVVAPFDGVVIDPSARWEPWIPERYGRTAVIESTEPTSAGYTTILSHLAALFVEPGQVVHRGEVIGLVGATGNAEGGRPHLHFELRAPFALSWQQVGEDRLIDAFNPYPSLRAADPRERN